MYLNGITSEFGIDQGLGQTNALLILVNHKYNSSIKIYFNDLNYGKNI